MPLIERPVSKAPADTSTRSSPNGGDERERQQRTILIVDDSPIHRRLLARQLERSVGCRILDAEGVEAAVSVLLAERPDLIISDLLMPDLDGGDLITILRTRDDWRDIPVVIHSVVNDMGRVQALIGSGVKAYILKPFDPALAVPRIRTILAGLSPREPASVPTRLAVIADRIPILLGTDRETVTGAVRRNVDSIYQVIAVPPGPSVVAAAIDIHPWAVLLTTEQVVWDTETTITRLRALKTVRHVSITTLACHEPGDTPTVACIREALAPPPFSMVAGDAEITVSVEETFTASCVGGLRRVLREAVGTGKRVVLDVASEINEPEILLAVEELERDEASHLDHVPGAMN